MNTLLKSVRILYPDGKLSDSLQDILIEQGVIRSIGSNIKAPADCDVFEGKGSYLSIGWMDMKANFHDPGDETMEGLPNGLDAAAAGGFTGVVLMPSTKPPIQTKSEVEYLINRAKGHAVDVHPAGCLSVDRSGTDITEMYDMKSAGAVAFTDDRRPVSDSGLMLRSMLYAKNTGSLIIAYPDDKSISGKGQVHESVNSTIAGLKGIPAFSEELIVSRDLMICEYTGASLHFSTLSSAASVDMIRKAKKKGLPVTAEVTANHLFFDDEVIGGYDTNFKVKPPFRGKEDKKALIQGVADGTIDVICSDHQPQDPESKITEFEFAEYGISGIETAFSASLSALKGQIGLERIIDSISVKPRKTLGIEIPKISEGSFANLTLFNPEIEWTPSENNLITKSKNNPFIGITLKGRVLAVFNNGKLIRNKV